MEPVDAKVLYDYGTHVVVLPKHVPVGRIVRVGEPRNLEATVVKHEKDGLPLCRIHDEFFPRRTVAAHDWLPPGLLGEHGPLIEAPEAAA